MRALVYLLTFASVIGLGFWAYTENYATQQALKDVSRLNAAIADLREALEARGVRLILAGRKTEFLNELREMDLYRPEQEQRFFPTLRQAVKAWRSRSPDAPSDPKSLNAA